MPKPQRIRDPIHDLITFDTTNFEQLAWSLIDCGEFQRLRRIKQLGFSELVFPGATHSRFSHSVGVFNTARQLADVIRTRTAAFDADRANVAMAAALVHDLGHGPFSHAFEDATAKLGLDKKHEDWTAEIIRGDTEVGQMLAAYGGGFRNDVADLLASETPTDIYSSIVSSQFDADRLDYMRRDRLMTGAQHGGFDCSWLLANLEVDRIAFNRDDEEYAEVDGLVLGNKAFQAAEEYVLGLFHLYFSVYFHKTTRSAEKMLSALVRRLGELVAGGGKLPTGINPNGPLTRFLRERTLATYLALDDTAMWQALHELSGCKEASLAELARRLLARQLYKGVDIAAMSETRGGEAAVASFRVRLAAARSAGDLDDFDLFEDAPSRSPYKRRGYDTPEALSKVFIRRPDGTSHQDLAERSDVVKALQQKTLYRIYVRNHEVKDKILTLANGVGL